MHLLGDKNKPTEILIASGDENHLQALDFGSKGGGGSSWGSSSSYFGPSYYGTFGYGYGYNNNNNA